MLDVSLGDSRTPATAMPTPTPTHWHHCLVRFLLIFPLLVLSAFTTPAQQVVNGNTSYVPGAWSGTQIPNANITGTTLHSIAKLTGTGTAVISGTSDTTGMLGIVGSGAGTNGNATIVTSGQVVCNFDANGTTANNYVVNSSVTPGDCADGGSTLPSSLQVFGRVLSTNIGAGSYTVAVTNGGTALSGVSLTTDNTWTNNNRFAGPVPFVDVTAYGARALPGGAPFTHGDCTNGSNQITNVAGASWGFAFGFNPNDGITLYGCGATNTMTTPAGLVVTPGGTWGLTNTQSPVTGAAATGSSSYQYTVIARDKFGALTAPATPVTIANGLAALGKQTRTISTLSRSNDIITVVTTSAHNLLANDLIELIPTSSQQFGGWYNVAQIDSSTQFEVFNTPVDTRAQGWMLGDTTSYSGGVVVFYRNNYLTWTPVTNAWMYYVCAKRPGDPSLALIGMTRPSISGAYIDASFEDYGSPYQDNQVYPSYVTNSSCTGTATNDPLTSYIVSSPDGGSTLILHDAASQNKTGTLAVFDAAPGIARAAAVAAFQSPNFLGSTIYIPPSTQSYLVNSYLAIPARISILQSGRLQLNETIAIAGSTNWSGDFASESNPQFGFTSGAQVTVGAGTPGVYASGDGNSFQKLVVNSTNANGAVLVVDDSATSNYDFVDLSTGSGSTDYLGMTIVVRGHSSIETHFFNRSAFLTGPDQVNDKSWQPSMWIAPGQNFSNVGIEIVMKDTSWNRRGIVEGGGGNTGIFGNSGQCPDASFTSYYSYRQGGITPMMASLNCSSHNLFSFTDASQDTEGQPLLANLNANASAAASGKLGPKLFAHNDTGGAQAPLVQGIKPSSIDINSGIFSSAKSIPNRGMLYKTSGNMWLVTSPYDTVGSYIATVGGPLYTIAQPVHGTGGYSWWFDLPAPTNVSGTPAAGGSLAAGTYLYTVSAVGADSGDDYVCPVRKRHNFWREPYS